MDQKLNIKALTDFTGFVKRCHWTSPKHSWHEVLNELYETLDGKFDEFVEAYLGKFPDGVEVEDVYFEDSEGNLQRMDGLGSIFNLASDLLDYLEPFSELDSGLMSIFDDIKEALSKAMYLLRME